MAELDLSGLFPNPYRDAIGALVERRRAVLDRIRQLLDEHAELTKQIRLRAPAADLTSEPSRLDRWLTKLAWRRILTAYDVDPDLFQTLDL